MTNFNTLMSLLKDKEEESPGEEKSPPLHEAKISPSKLVKRSYTDF
jgi:hypothetical protein